MSVHSTITRACSSDIELNPGPNNVNERSKSCERTIKTRQLTLTAADQAAAQPTLADIMNEMRDMQAELVQKVDNACGDIKKVKEDCSKLRRDVEQLEHDNTNLKRQLDSVEGQARRNNVVIRGIPERRGETWEECEKLVRQSMVDDLQIDAEEVEKINIERAHRLPQRRGRDRNESRDIIAKFAFFKDKGKVMEKAKTLKPKGLFYMQDFTQRVKQARAQLKDKLLAMRDLGYKAFYSHDKLVVLDEDSKRNVYVYDERKENPVAALYTNFRERVGVKNDKDNDQPAGGDEKYDNTVR